MAELSDSVTVRVPVPDDALALRAMFRRCSAESAYARFLAPVAEIPPRHLADVVHRGPDRWSCIAIDDETARVVAVATLFRLGPGAGEVAVLVEDAEQRRGLGSGLLDLLAACASRAGIRALVGVALVRSHHVLRMLARLGHITTRSSGATCEIVVSLRETRAVPVATPTVIGPIVGRRAPWGAPADLGGRGYRVEEFQLEGSAGGYQLRAGTDATDDGHWEVERYAEAPYRTRILVVRPERPEWFNGTVVVNWQNVSAGFESGGPSDGELFEGYAWVGVSAQEVGLYGFPPGMDRYGGRGGTPLVEHDPERYGSLHHPGDQASFDIFSQAGHAVGPHRTGTVDPMGGLAVRRLVAMGGSQSAMRLVAYYNAFQRDAAVFDAFLLSVWEGRAPRPEEGAIAMGVRTTIRTDLTTPVVVVNSEFEATHLAGLPITDTEHLRVWEVAGTPHGVARGRHDQPDARGRVVNRLSIRPVHDAALRAVHEWVAHGTPAPSQPRIAVDDGRPPGIRRDDAGNAIGGIRLPELEAPTHEYRGAAFGTGRAPLFGSARPLPDDELRARFPDRETYVERWQGAVDALVQSGALRPEDGPAMKARARDVTLPAR